MTSLTRDLLALVIVAAVILGAIAAIVGLAFLLTKSLGVFLIVFGIFMMFIFPDISDYQEVGIGVSKFVSTGVIIGIIAIIGGLILLFV